MVGPDQERLDADSAPAATARDLIFAALASVDGDRASGAEHRVAQALPSSSRLAGPLAYRRRIEGKEDLESTFGGCSPCSWSDVDLDRAVLRVERSLEQHESRAQAKAARTNRGRRNCQSAGGRRRHASGSSRSPSSSSAYSSAKVRVRTAWLHSFSVPFEGEISLRVKLKQ